MEKIWTKIKLFAKYLVVANFGRLILSFIIATVFMAIDNKLYDNNHDYNGWAFWVAAVGLAYMVGFTLVAMVYGWIINPIRDWKARQKK